MGPGLQRAYAVAALLGVELKLTPVMFEHIHARRQPPRSRDDVKALFENNGLKAEDFDGAVDSFAVSSLVTQYDRNTESFNIRSVPALLINGKYRVKIESISSQDQFNRLVNFLLTKKD